MRKTTTALVVLLATLAAVAGCSKITTGPQATATPAVVNCAAAEAPSNFPPTPNTIESTCAVIPKDMNGTGDTQGPVDLYSWLTFVAVNWPVDASTCAANSGASILNSPPDPVWLSYLSDDEIFVSSGSPANWCNGPSPVTAGGVRFASVQEAVAAQRAGKLAKLPPKVRSLAEQHPEAKLFLHHSAKGHALVSISNLIIPANLKEILDATGEPLTDQNGRFVRYTVNIGPDEDQYIMEKTLWTKAGQQATGDLNFPPSSKDTLGPMEFKAAWKILGANDNPAHFFTQLAIVYNDEDGNPSPGPNPVTVGLVGLHITHKTARQKNWLWSTFEQVENDKSFNNPNCPESQCPPNIETAATPYLELNPDGTPHNKPVQVVPIIKTTAAELNITFQGLLKGTPWAYYKLVSTQWQGGSGPLTKPPQLGNSVLETFVGNTKPYSCLDCHTMAQDFPGGFKSDFSFAINAKQ